MATPPTVVDACRWCRSPMLRSASPCGRVAQCRACGKLIVLGPLEVWPADGFPTEGATTLHPAPAGAPEGVQIAVRWGRSGRALCKQFVQAVRA